MAARTCLTPRPEEAASGAQRRSALREPHTGHKHGRDLAEVALPGETPALGMIVREGALLQEDTRA